MLFPKLLGGILFCLIIASRILPAQAQNSKQAVLTGKVQLPDGYPAEFINVVEKKTNTSSTTDEEGKYVLKLPPNQDLLLTFTAVYIQDRVVPLRLKPGQKKRLDVEVQSKVGALDTVSVTGKRYQDKRMEAGMITFDPKKTKYIPTPTGDFNQILKTLGAGGNNELSSGYNVRGGNFDENLIYVNDMLVYRPFLVSNGQQEGLSFVNPDLVSNVRFSTGGWQPRYGDKLSSVLDVNYRAPREWESTVSLGVLNSAFSLGGASENERFRFVFGARNKSTRYLFQNSDLFRGLDVQGQYFPSFQDVQGWMEYDLTPKDKRKTQANRTTIGMLLSYARNRYEVLPQSRETTFGSLTQALRLFVAFEGRETMDYDTRQLGLRFTHRFNKHFRSTLTVSGIDSREREKTNVEGGYRLCDVNTNFGSESFNECVFDRGIGTFFQYSRNDLDMALVNWLNRNYFLSSDTSIHSFEFGFGGSYEAIDDRLYEYEYRDSSDFIDVTQFMESANFISSHRIKHYAQHSIEPNKRHTLTYGYRLNYWTLNEQLLFSPRIQYGYKPAWEKDWVFKAAAGVYQQPPFYRELRTMDGELNRDLKAQRSYHALLGGDHNLHIWGRPFKISMEAYFKYIENAVAYVVDNVRIRYYANNNTTAYATGVDFRMSGEFIKGTESWFYAGVQTVREELTFDDKGWVNRPTDQRVQFGCYFEDHLPNNPTIRANLNLVVGTGLPVGPPENVNTRTSLRLPAYRRLDVGFAKVLGLSDKSTRLGKFYESAWLGLEVLNVLGVQNTVSYLWIEDINNNQWGVPNSLSARFLNLKAIVKL